LVQLQMVFLSQKKSRKKTERERNRMRVSLWDTACSERE
jgi:hypothetical protein